MFANTPSPAPPPFRSPAAAPVTPSFAPARSTTARESAFETQADAVAVHGVSAALFARTTPSMGTIPTLASGRARNAGPQRSAFFGGGSSKGAQVDPQEKDRQRQAAQAIRAEQKRQEREDREHEERMQSMKQQREHRADQHKADQLQRRIETGGDLATRGAGAIMLRFGLRHMQKQMGKRGPIGARFFSIAAPSIVFGAHMLSSGKSLPKWPKP